MCTRNRGLICVAIILLVACSTGTALAQTRLTIEGSALFPLGSTSDDYNVSPMLGAKIEMQKVNALGNIATRSWFIRADYAWLDTKSNPEDPIDEVGSSTESYYFEAVIGGRAYAGSKINPFFFSLSAGYANHDPVGDVGAKSGVATNLGIGIRIGLVGFVLEAEVRGNYAIMQDIDNLLFVTGVAGIGIPF